MKKLLITLFFLGFCSLKTAHAQNLVPQSMANVNFSLVNWEKGEVLVRFADHLSPVLNGQKSQVKIDKIDQILKDYSGVKLEQLFPVQKPIPSGEKGFTTYTGNYYEYPKLTNIYKVTIKDTVFGSIFPLITAFESLGEDYVVYAEPNYLFESDVTIPPTDALYQYQYNAVSMNADSAWQIMNDSSITDEDIIISIIDTGVDTSHVDLKGKKHVNLIELNGIPGVDDDSNGYIDDISGWDFVNMDNGPIDDNSHGTHCAAIAVANHDSVGIVGIAPNAKYLPMKGLESSGGSASSVLAQCVTYSANNGADILSMSFGGYGRSFVMENALSYAYAFSMPVGAAGNNGICIRNDGQLCPDGTPPAPMYPGAYSFVLAVQATQQNSGGNGYRAWFTNYDFDGPTYTDYGDDFNYEVYAPGLGIISAIPGNQYATWNGTSMACPAVAGAMAIYQSFRPNRTKEQAFVDFISSWYDLSKTFDKGQGWSTNFQSMDLVKAIYPDPMPLLWLDEFTVIDTAQGDADYKLDAGEVSHVRVDIKNVGTEADSVFVGIRMAQFEDKTIINFIDSVSYIGSISSYATVSNNTAMFKVDVDPGVVNGRNINFNIYCWTPGGDTTSQDFVVEAQSGCEYNGIYSGITTWGPDCGIIVTGNSVFDTLIIKPGTEIQIDPAVGLAFNHIQAIGKPDSMIVFTKNQNSYGTWMEIKAVGNAHQTFEYCVFEYGGRTGSIGGGEIIGPSSKVSLDNCVIRFCKSTYSSGWNILTLSGSSSYTNCTFYNNQAELAVIGIEDNNWTGTFSNNVVHDNRYNQYYGEQPFLTFRTPNDISRISDNSLFRHNYSGWGSSRNIGYVLGVRDGNGGGHGLSTYVGNYLDSNYFGFTNTASIEANILDFQEVSSFPAVDGSTNALSRPKSSPHGHVWKVLVDDSLNININDNPIHNLLGLGTHKVDVYFNRPMDVSRNPFVTYGVRDPWTQNIVGDSTSWSSDSVKWTGYFDITQLTASDGYNTLSVRQGYDNEGFETPIEDYRFEFRINVASVLSTGFTAVGDTSEIRLSWTAPDSIVDLIGYNILRVDTSQSYSDTSIINSSLVLDTNYTDENVVGGNYYLYYYTPVRSSFTQSQRSIGVWAAPYSAKPSVRTIKAQETRKGSIQFNAGVDANFISTDARFIYGTSPSNLTGATSWQAIGSNYYEVSYDRSIGSVTPGIVYYYKAQARNALGMETGELDSLLTESTPVITLSGDSQICLGDSIILSAQAITPDTTIALAWKYNGAIIGSGYSLKYLPTSQGTYSIEAIATGSYTTEYSSSFNVTVINPASNPIAISYNGATQLCQGESLALNLPSGYSDIVWSTGDTTSTIVASQTGSYSATMKTSVGGCTATSNTVNVVVNANPSATISSLSGNFICAGSTANLNAPTGMSSYEWFKDGVTITGANTDVLLVSSGGNYQVKVSNSDGCTDLSVLYALTINSLPTGSITSASSLEFCQGDSVILSGPNGMSYSWSNGDTTSQIIVHSTTTAGLTITNSDGCTSVLSPVNVTVNQVPNLIVSNSSSLEFCFGNSVNLQASGGFANYTWNDGSTNQSLIATSSGTYEVTGTTNDGCSATSSPITVIVNPNPTAMITNSGSSVLCSGDSTTLSAPLGMSSYLWSDGSTGQSIVTSQSGSYSVTVTNASGCSATSSATTITTSTMSAPSVTSSGSTSLCLGSSVTLSVPTGYSSYLWSDGSTTNSITPNATGNYSVTVTNADGCSATSASTSVTVNTPPTVGITSTGTGAICAGASELLSATPGMSSYQWYKDGTAIVGATSSSYTAGDAANYSVSVVDTNGCSSLSTSYTITNASAPTAMITNSGSSVLCSGDSTTLSAPLGMSSYLWSDGSTGQSIVTSQSGSYSVTVTNASGCSATSSATTITTSTMSAPSVTSSGSTSLCLGSSVTLSVPTGYSSYLWSDGSTTNSIAPNATGNYSVTVTNADGCSATSASTSVTVNTPPTVGITSTGTGAICAGASELLSATPGMSSYQWYKDGTAIVGATSSSYTAGDAANYSVSVVDTNGCSSLSTSYTITNASAPTAMITNSGSSVLCSGDSTTLSAPLGMSSYLWSDGSTGQSIVTSQSGSYSVTVTNASGCSATSSATTITTSTMSAPSVTSSGSTSLCLGSSVTLSVPTGYSSYLWSDGSTTNSITPNATGNYSVTVTNADGCSATSASTSVTVNTPPTVGITSTGTGAICAGASELLSATPGMSSYQWYKDGTAIVGATSSSYTAGDAANYSVSVVDTNGCSSLSTSYTITNASAPTAMITNSGSSVLCSGDSTTLSAPLGMSSYLWSDGSTGQSIVTSQSGSYSVTVTNASGCSATSSATTITTSTMSAPSVTSSGPVEFCTGGDVILAVPLGYAGFLWNNGSNYSQVTVTSSGNYFAQVMNANGCIAYSDTVTVIVQPLPPTPSISYTANDTIMTSSEPVGNQWYFNGNIMQGETGQTIRPLNQGNYSVRIIDSNGCEGDMSAMQFYNSIGLEENLADQIRLYPNPTQGRVTLELNQFEAASLKVIDATGRIVIHSEGCTGECELDLSETGTGMYQILLITKDGRQVIKSIIVNR